MLKIAAPVWIMLGTVLAGSAVIAVLSIPALAAHEREWIPIVAIAGYLGAIPIALAVSVRMRDAFAR